MTSGKVFRFQVQNYREKKVRDHPLKEKKENDLT